MFTKKVLILAITAISFIGYTSCSSDDKDTTGPNIELEAPADGNSYAKGKDIHIEFELDDESGINNYKVDIHWAAGHTHSGEKAEMIPWSYQKVYEDKKGQKNAHVHVHSEVIPETAQVGDYHFGVIATDMVGNASRKYITIKITE